VTAIHYAVEPFEPEIVEAYRRMFPESADHKGLAVLRWRFEESPHGPGLFAVARDNGRIIGMIALVATKLRVGAELHLAYQAIDTVVDPAYRGRGVFVGLGQAAQDSANHGGRVLWGFPNANAAPGWFGRLGWRNFGTVPFLVRPLRSGYALRKLLPFLGRIDLPLIGQARPSGDQREIVRFDDQAGSLWNAARAGGVVGVERDAAWLNWRLMDKPAAHYRSVGVYDSKGRLEGFVSTCILAKHSGRICYVMEAMSPVEKPASVGALLRDELARAAQLGAEIALAWCPANAPGREGYRRAGFLSLPDRLRPIEIHFGARAVVPEAAPAVESGSNWFISYLDSDTV
jgi:GNAT superfamily N-acetyltransferase